MGHPSANRSAADLLRSVVTGYTVVMCGRFTLTSSAEDVVELFEPASGFGLTTGFEPAGGFEPASGFEPRYNIAPTQTVPIVRLDPVANVRRLDWLRWGLIPSWVRDSATASGMINARAETLSAKPSFRSAFKCRRCLVVADGFYEWKKLGGKPLRGDKPLHGGKPLHGRRKQPFYIRMNDAKPFAFAGLWERWERPDHPAIESCTIITTEPNALMASLHNRMPVILV